ncbi:MAG: hypothetical protein KGZ93_10455 [Actinobacteria bacterium]|nr:hypothetical protein [Actinomycetota bacterium]
MPKLTMKHLSFFLRRFLRYNVELFYLQSKMPKWSEHPDEQLAQSLNDRRLAAHREILDATRDHGHLCGSCGRCCLERVERHTDFDQFIHAGIGQPLHHFDKKILNLPLMITTSAKRTVQRMIGKDLAEPKPCRYLSKSGCTLTHQQRPMLCVSWFCPKYIFGMDPSSLDCLEKPLNEMRLIHHEIAKAVFSRDTAS